MSDVVDTGRSVRITNESRDDLLDMPPWRGQRRATFRFIRVNAVSGDYLGDLHPLRDQTANLSHDTSRTIKRQLRLYLGKEDTDKLNPVSDRVLVYMTFPNGKEYPLGKYMFTDESLVRFTSGSIANLVLNDEMYLVDQLLVEGFIATISVQESTARLLSDVKVTLRMEETNFTPSNLSWPAGASRGGAIEELATQGDFFSPWFGNDTYMHFIRSFDPAAKVPDFDWDNTNVVLRSGIVETTDLLNAANRFLVVSNGPGGTPIAGVSTVPPNAPHSFENRGFYITEKVDTQTTELTQVQAMARNLALRKTAVERVSLTTVPDPRHDSYNVIFWRGAQWLELSWNLDCVEGGAMRHDMRKTYSGGLDIGSVTEKPTAVS